MSSTKRRTRLDAQQDLPRANWLEDARSRAAFRRVIRRWFTRAGRDLPWRKRRTLYRVWVSEIMLQQTQVVTVIPYFDRFVRRFPNVAALAAAAEADVLRAWEGLGYYRRARNLHAAASKVVREHGGRLPRSREALESLPGIGRYTAAAILSFALDEPHPVLEANTRRFYSRLIGATGASGAARGTSDKVLWQFAERILPRQRAADWNDALMDLGSTVCTPVDPDCKRCPARNYCAAFAAGDARAPANSPPQVAITRLHEAAVVVRSGRHLLMQRRREDEWWSGLWDFVRFSWDEADRAAVTVPLAIGQRICHETGIAVECTRQLPTIRHAVTRYRIRLDCFEAQSRVGKPRPHSRYTWVHADEAAQLPLTSTARKLMNAALSRDS